MKLETFFKHFDLLAEAPNGVQKLRELILDLAVRGKLVPQDENDEPAAVLLERIKKEKERLVKEGKIKKEKYLEPAIKDDEIPFEVQKNWLWMRFCDIATIASNLVKPELYLNLPHIAPDNIEKQTGKLLSYCTVKEDNVRSAKHKFFSGQILYSKIRPNLAKVTFIQFDGLCSADMYPINSYIDSKYLIIYMLSRTFLNMAIKNDTRVAMPKINQDELNKILVSIPPLAEQKRIVTKVDELMKLCDELEARQKKKRETRILINNAALNKLLTADTPETFTKNWQRIGDNFDILYSAPENIGKLRQAILQLAVMGKLVPQDANDEPAAVLLERIKKEKERLVKEGKVKKEKSLPAIKNDEIPFDLPKGWEWVRMQDIFTVITDGDHQPPPKTDSGIPFLVISNVRKEILDFTATRFVSEKYFSSLDEIRTPRKGDILYTVVGSYGIPIIVDTDKPFCVQRHIAILKSSKLLEIVYLKYLIKSDIVFSQATKYATGIAQKTVPLNGLRKIIVPLPPINEQKKIAAKVDKLMKLCDELETKLTQTQTESEKIINAAVKQLLTVYSNPI